jgi:hypothetical protein
VKNRVIVLLQVKEITPTVEEQIWFQPVNFDRTREIRDGFGILFLATEKIGSKGPYSKVPGVGPNQLRRSAKRFSLITAPSNTLGLRYKSLYIFIHSLPRF